MAYFTSKRGKGKKNKTMTIGSNGRGFSRPRSTKKASKYRKGKAY
jgi:hypothetical protein